MPGRSLPSDRQRYRQSGADDLAGIDDCTSRRWDDEQARRYIAAIWAAFDRLALMPRLGRIHRDLPGYHRHKSGSTLSSIGSARIAAIEVLNVLQQSMDLAAD